MEPNAIPALVMALQSTPYGAHIVVYVPLVVSIAAVLAAILPHPAEGSPWAPARKLLDMLAVNVGSAKNAQGGSTNA